MEDEKPEINLKQHRRHKRTLPWQFVIKVVMGITVVVLLYYFAKTLLFEPKNEAPVDDEIEVIIE